MTRQRAASSAAGAALLLSALAERRVASAIVASFGASPDAAVPTDRLLDLAVRHGALSLASVGVSTLAGLAVAIFITRSVGAQLRPVVDTLVAALQAVPPVVVIALSFPALGFGAAPTILALVFYCLMPIVRGTVAALDAVPADVKEAARATGFTRWQLVSQVELPLALPLIAEAVRLALVLAIATAAVGALAGAATLGTPIISGLQSQNPVQILQGASATAALAFAAEALWLLILHRLEETEPSC